ncbi:MAG TPA: hypothetical protein VKA70_17280 [Blastocatellia bacterium]|nr:hypothetical protein [Blastocatellia bacterium]
MTKERWLAISTVTVFALALVGAAYAAYVLIPPIVADPQSKSTLLVFLISLVVAFAVIFLLFRRRQKGS